MGARWPDSWEWRKVAAGHYLAEGYEIKRLKAGDWRVTRRGLLVSGPRCSSHMMPSLAVAIEAIDEDMARRA